MEPEGSLPHSQELANCPYPKPEQSSPHPLPIFWRSILKLASHQRLGIPSGFFPSGLAIKTLYAPLLSPIRATCSTCLILLYVFTLMLFSGEWMLCLCVKNYVKQTHWNEIKIMRNHTHKYVRIRWEVSRTAVLVSGSNIVGCPNNIVTTVAVVPQNIWPTQILAVLEMSVVVGFVIGGRAPFCSPPFFVLFSPPFFLH